MASARRRLSTLVPGALPLAAGLALLGLQAVRAAPPVPPPSIVADVHAGATAFGSYPSRPVASGAFSFYGASTPAFGRELWRTDGTPTGTAMVKDAEPGSADAGPEYLVDLGGVLLYNGSTPEAGAGISPVALSHIRAG